MERSADCAYSPAPSHQVSAMMSHARLSILTSVWLWSLCLALAWNATAAGESLRLGPVGERHRLLDKLVKNYQAEIDLAERDAVAALRQLLALRLKEGNATAVAAIKETLLLLEKIPPGAHLPAVDIPAIDTAKFAQRDPARHRQVLDRNGIAAGEDSLIAIRHALRWLQLAQKPDGSWGEDSDQYATSLTGLAVLAYLGVGETSASLEFGDTVANGLAWLSRLMITKRGRIQGHIEYTQPIVVMALAEAAAMERNQDLLDLTVLGTQTIVAGQNPVGGFFYGYHNKLDQGKLRMDLSIGGWNYQAMATALFAGAGSPEVTKAMTRGAECIITKFATTRAGFGYNPGSNWPSASMTASGTYSLIMLGRTDDDQLVAALELLGTNFIQCNWNEPDSRQLYRWYYQTLAMFHGRDLRRSSKYWKQWQRQVTKELTGNQQEDGSWLSPRYEPYDLNAVSVVDFPDKIFNCRIYATAMASLVLETWFRFSPLVEKTK